MNPQTILQELANEVGGSFRGDYSGRGMFGRTCCGIACDNPTEVIELAAERGIKGAAYDNMGKRYIVYWPEIASIEA